MWSASSPWPHASWKRMPPLPPASTMGTSPDGAGRADSLASARRLPSAAISSTAVALEDLEALGEGQGLEARLHARVADRHTDDVEPCADLIVRASSPSELATSTRRRLSPQPTCTWVMAPPVPRAASSARVSSSILRALSTASGGVRSRRSCTDAGPSATVRTAAPPAPPPPPPHAAAASSPASLRSAVWAKPVVSPSTTRIPAPRDRPEESSSTLRSSSMALAVAVSSANTSARSPPPTRAADRTRSSTSESMRVVSVTAVS